MNVIRHDDIPTYEPCWFCLPGGSQNFVCCVLGEDRFSVLGAYRDENNDWRVVPLDRLGMRRMFSPDLVHKSQYYWDDLRVISIISSDGQSPSLHYLDGVDCLPGTFPFLPGTSSCGATSYSGLGIPISQRSNQPTIFWSRSTRCHG